MIIFVYGTLKRNHKRSYVLRKQRFIQEVNTCPLYCLYNGGRYPVLVEGDLSICGELWKVDNECLDILNGIEGVPFLYDLKEIKIPKFNNVYAYFWQLSINGLPMVGSIWDSSQIEN